MGDNMFKKLREIGISSIPVAQDKKPKVAWKDYQKRLPTIQECEKWDNIKGDGIAVVCGRISGNIEVIDIDNKFEMAEQIYEDITRKITAQRIDLLDKLVFEKSKNNGYHIIYRCNKIEGNQKLAIYEDLNSGEKATVIETRGEGGYCIIYPSPGYQQLQKNILKVEEITEEERDYLFELCGLWDNGRDSSEKIVVNDKKTDTNTNKNTDEIDIFEWYNERDDFIQILTDHGWKELSRNSKKITFKRPGKEDNGGSADFLFEKRCFHVFTSNGYPFENDENYSPFDVFMMLEANGDLKEAVKLLLEKYPELDKNNKKSNKKIQKNDKNTDNSEQNEKKNEQKYDIFEFWNFKSKTNHDELVIDLKKLAFFLYRNDFFYYYKDKDSNVLVREIAKNIIEQVTENYIIKFLQDYIKSLPNDYYFDNNNQFDKNYLIELLSVLNERNLDNVLHNLERRELEFNKDTEDTCYKYFKNCIVKITASKVEYLQYLDLKKYIWKENIIDRDFHTQDPVGKVSEVFEFHKLVTSSRNVLGEVVPNPQRHNALRSALGYLMHNYKGYLDTKAIVFCEEQVSDSGGRTGKTLTCQMLEQMGEVFAKINGRNVDFRNRFLFQNVEYNTNIISIDDTSKRFNFGGLYSVITNGLIVEKKNKTSIQLSHQDTPKFVITTNQVLTDDSNSGRSRKFEIEFSDYFSDDHTPADEFGHLFFKDWDDEQWNLFYDYMIGSIQLYLYGGLIKYESKTLKNRKLEAYFEDDNLLNFCDSICLSILLEKKNMSNKEIFEEWQKISDNNELKQTDIKKTMNKFIEISHLKSIKQMVYREGDKTQRGFCYIPMYANSKETVEFIQQHEKTNNEILEPF